MPIDHTTVATGTPLIGAAAWNADHTNPTLAEVLVAGNDVGVSATITTTPPVGLGGSVLNLTATQALLEATDGDAGQVAGLGILSGGYGNGGQSNPAIVNAFGGGPTGAGGDLTITTGDAQGGTDTHGGDVRVTPGAGDGVGRNGLVFLNLPTSDPGVPGALYSLAGVVKVS